MFWLYFLLFYFLGEAGFGFVRSLWSAVRSIVPTVAEGIVPQEGKVLQALPILQIMCCFAFWKINALIYSHCNVDLRKLSAVSETKVGFPPKNKSKEQNKSRLPRQIVTACIIRTCLHKHMRTSFRQILPQTALKILAGRKPACGFLPTLQQNYARKSAHISYEDRF